MDNTHNSGRQESPKETRNVLDGLTIAIAGAKGGCGKSTLSLSLGAAFARSGTGTIVVDADRQLPDLHAMIGVRREPTLADVNGDTDIKDVAQQWTVADDVAIVPPPTEVAPTDFRTMLSDLTLGQKNLVIDCPSGFGPDFVDPVTVADIAVVVTTTGERSVEAAKRTVDVAGRMGTPVLGVVISRANSVEAGLQSQFSVPILGTVQESKQRDPLGDGGVQNDIDEVLNSMRQEYTSLAESI